jgi:hypothetical protein
MKVLLESEHLHRQAYNDAFVHFGVRCPPAADAPLDWDEAFYDILQNRIGGGKPKMRWYVTFATSIASFGYGNLPLQGCAAHGQLNR